MILRLPLGFSYPGIMIHLSSQLFYKQCNEQATSNLEGGLIFIH